jgi:hypothetical protein
LASAGIEGPVIFFQLSKEVVQFSEFLRFLACSLQPLAFASLRQAADCFRQPVEFHFLFIFGSVAFRRRLLHVAAFAVSFSSLSLPLFTVLIVSRHIFWFVCLPLAAHAWFRRRRPHAAPFSFSFSSPAAAVHAL